MMRLNKLPISVQIGLVTVLSVGAIAATYRAIYWDTFRQFHYGDR
jgi:hypothetical protein